MVREFLVAVVSLFIAMDVVGVLSFTSALSLV
jgi:hypothetical protein